MSKEKYSVYILEIFVHRGTVSYEDLGFLKEAFSLFYFCTVKSQLSDQLSTSR